MRGGRTESGTASHVCTPRCITAARLLRSLVLLCEPLGERLLAQGSLLVRIVQLEHCQRERLGSLRESDALLRSSLEVWSAASQN